MPCCCVLVSVVCLFPHHCGVLVFFGCIPPSVRVRRRASVISHYTTHLTQLISQTCCEARAVRRASWRSCGADWRRRGRGCLLRGRRSTQSLVATHPTALIHTTHLTPLISHHSSHTTPLTPLLSHHSSHTTHLTPLIPHHSLHTTHLRPLINYTPLISDHSSHSTHHTTAHLTPLLSQHSSHNHSSHTTQLIPNVFRWKTQNFTCGVIRSFYLLFGLEVSSFDLELSSLNSGVCGECWRWEFPIWKLNICSVEVRFVSV